MTFIVFLAFMFAGAGLLVTVAIIHKNLHLWLGSYLRRRLSSTDVGPDPNQPIDVLFCFVDHFEPGWGKPGIEIERTRVARWTNDYPKLVEEFQDFDGRSPKHTFFFPEEEYREEHLDELVQLCREGHGEIEIHSHHEDENEESLAKLLAEFRDLLHERHGALGRNRTTGEVSWLFIHGNWALCNSQKDGRYCGVDEELHVLRAAGCVCDMTMPSAPSETQARTINSIYYAKDTPGRNRGHDYGLRVSTETEQAENEVMILPGVLGLNWHNRSRGLLPKIENSDIRCGLEPTTDRVDHWVRTGIHVKGQPNWNFIKVHTHGAPERDWSVLLSTPVQEMHRHLTRKYNDGIKYRLHYVSAREMYNIAKAAEAGMVGNPNDYRDFVIEPPPMLHSFAERAPHEVSR
ncbi:MAG: hypothetical protein AAGI88_21055 [Pseudomonadota bacterium]